MTLSIINYDSKNIFTLKIQLYTYTLMEPVNSLEIDPRAYRFFPKREEEKSVFEKGGTRFYFYGQIEHDQYQLRKLREFHEYVAHKNKVYDKELFNDQKILLFLSGCKYKPKQALKVMQQHRQFTLEYLKRMNPLRVQPLLRDGFFYPCGRDKHFRPFLIFQARLLPKDLDICFQAIVAVHEECKRLLLPGQVQCWNVLYDLKGVGLTDLPLTSLGKHMSRVSNNYGGKLFRLWVVNAPSSITVPWSIVSNFLDQVTIDKIKITKQSTYPSIFQLHDPSQVEERYGGTQPNRNEFWPFSLPPAVVDESRLASDEEYTELLKSGKLVRNIIDPKFRHDT